jgi:hypothetical protein
MACFVRLLAGARSASGLPAFDQAILEAESIQVFDGLMRPAQGSSFAWSKSAVRSRSNS